MDSILLGGEKSKTFSTDTSEKAGISTTTIGEEIRIVTDIAPDIQEVLIKEEISLLHSSKMPEHLVLNTNQIILFGIN